MSPPLPPITLDRRNSKASDSSGRWDALTSTRSRGKRRPLETTDVAVRYRRLVDQCCEHVKVASLEDTSGDSHSPCFTPQQSADLSHLLDLLSQQQYDRLPVDVTVPLVIPELFCTILLLPEIDSLLIARLLQEVLPQLLQKSPQVVAALCAVDPTTHWAHRTRLLHTLQQCLPQSAECLIVALEVLSSVPASEKIASTPGAHRPSLPLGDLDLRRLQAYWREQCDAAVADAGLAPRHETTSALRLLRTILQCAPQICQSHTLVEALLFPQYSSTNGNSTTLCPTCHCAAVASFLQILHHPADDDALIRPALECTILFLRQTPWSLWLGHSTTMAGKRSTTMPRSSFQQNLCHLLHNIIRIASCQLHAWNEKDDKTPLLRSLLHAIFMTLPYNNSSSGARSLEYGYERSAVDLVDAVMIGSTSCRSVLIECLRGFTTPAGVVAHTAVPVEAWIRHGKGRTWVRNLLVELVKDENGTSTIDASKNVSLLCSILGSHPSILLDPESGNESDASSCLQEIQNDIWQSFQCFVQRFSIHDPAIASRCIEQLLHGRHCYMKHQVVRHQKELLELCVPILAHWILSEEDLCDVVVVTLATSGFSSFLPQDWDTIPFLTCSVDVQRLIDQMIAFCTSRNRSDSFRSHSCKAIGSLCTNFISSHYCISATDSDHKSAMGFEFCMNVLSSMKHILVNDNASSVQCMAMFAIGNLSHAWIQSLRATCAPDDDALFRRFSQAMELIHDVTELCLLSISKDQAKNEKLVTNAVRTTGYMTVLMVDLQKRCAPWSGMTCSKCEDSIQQLVQRVLHTYTQTIRTAIELASPSDVDQVHNRRSWKERSGIKKQGWGSCNALSFLFENKLWIDSVGRDSSDNTLFYQEAASCLVECLESWNTVHEKMVMSACVALRSIPDLSFLDTNVFSRSLVACSTVLFDESSESKIGTRREQIQKLYAEVDGFLFRLLCDVSIAPLHLALQVPGFCSCLDNLYYWMIQHPSLLGHTYRCFAVAISNATANVSVQVEEQFHCQVQSYSSRVQSDVSEEL